MKIYTKTGDDGSTGLYGGSRTSKSSLRIRAIGDCDEANACLGLALTEETGLDQEIQTIQSRLFDLGAELANPIGNSRACVTDEDATFLESSIDRMNEELMPLRAFILPGGSKAAAWLHLARTVCRRMERSLVELNAAEPVRIEALIFVNRLSDWLFMAARFSNAQRSISDVEWHPRLPLPTAPSSQPQ